MKIKTTLLILLMFIVSLQITTRAWANSCEEIVAGHGLELSVTDGLWAFIVELLQRQDLQRSHLERMLAELNENRLENIYSPQEIFTNTTKLIYSQTAAEYFANSQLDRAKLKFRIEQKINELTQNQNERIEVKKQTANPIRLLKFIEVGVLGKLTLSDEHNNHVNTEINCAVAFSDTLVTQNQWASIMSANPAKHKGTDEVLGITQQPDHPVESITWYAAAWYANQLSKILGLPETYDFKNFIAKKGTSAATGSLAPAKKSGVVLINAPTIYEATGIRLPSDAELDWLIQNANQSNKSYPWGNKYSEGNDYCWTKENSNNQTHPLATKKPFMIRGHEFYDLFGNVYCWSNNIINNPALSRVKQPNLAGDLTGIYRIKFGGAYNAWRFNIIHGYEVANAMHGNLGFRLAYTCK